MSRGIAIFVVGFALAGCSGDTPVAEKRFPASAPRTAVLAQVPATPAIKPDPASKRQKPPKFIEPRLDLCTLHSTEQTLKPIRVQSPWREEHLAGGPRLVIDKSKAALFKASSDEATWTAESDDGRSLRWLAADEDVAYLQGYRLEAEKNSVEYETPLTIRRLDLRSGKWLPSLVLASEKTEPKQSEVIVSLSPGNGRLAALTETIREEFPQDRLLSYRVTCFSRDQVQPLWSRSFPAAGQRPSPGVFLWAVRRPNYAAQSLCHLSWFGDRLLVCAESVQDIICLDNRTGEDVWRVAKVWEFQRGFIGPSVWSHYISRFGIEPILAPDDNPEQQKQAREGFDKQYECAIIAGPVVVPSANAASRRGPRIFVGVSKGPSGSYAGFLSDCLVYELNERGHPISLVGVPHLIDGSS